MICKRERRRPNGLPFVIDDTCRDCWKPQHVLGRSSSSRSSETTNRISAHRLHGGRMRKNELNYILVGDYYIPDLQLPEEDRSIGKWGRMHRDYLKEHHPIQYNTLILSGKFWTYLAERLLFQHSFRLGARMMVEVMEER